MKAVDQSGQRIRWVGSAIRQFIHLTQMDMADHSHAVQVMPVAPPESLPFIPQFIFFLFLENGEII